LVVTYHSTASTILGGSGIQQSTRSAKDKLERHSQERPAEIGSQLGRGWGSSRRQKRIWSSACTWTPAESRSRGWSDMMMWRNIWRWQDMTTPVTSVAVRHYVRTVPLQHFLL